MTQPITSIDQLVAAFGGTGDFAKWLDVVPSCVSNWKEQGAIPRGYHLRIYLEGRRRGLTMAPSIFGLREWPVEPSERPRKRAAYQPAA